MTAMNDDDNDDRTPREHVVTDSGRVPRHPYREPAQDPVQMELADHQQRLRDLERAGEYARLDIASLVASRRMWRWIVGILIPTLAGAMITVLLFSAERVSSSAERVGAMNATIEALKDEVHNLRMKLDKLSKIDSPSITTLGANP